MADYITGIFVIQSIIAYNRTLVDGFLQANDYEVLWDGGNRNGTPVASGVYFCKMKTADFSSTRKLVLLR